MNRLPGLFWHSVLARNNGWKVIHWLAVAVLFWFAFILWHPSPTFETSPRSYALFAQVATEHTWAAIYFAIGFLGAASSFQNSLTLKIIAGMGLSVMHGVTAVLLVLGNPGTTGSGTYAIIAVAASLRLWRLVRAKIDER